MANLLLSALILLAATPAQSDDADSATLVITVDNKPVRMSTAVVTLDGYLLPLREAVEAMTHKRGSVRVDSTTLCSILVDGKVAATMPYGNSSSDEASLFDPPGSGKPARKVKLHDIAHDELIGKRKVAMMDVESLSALLGVGVDVDGSNLALLTPRYWLTMLDLEEKAEPGAVNPLNLVPVFGISPPADVMLFWVKPPNQNYVQIYKLSDGIGEPMLGINPQTSREVTLEEGDIEAFRAAGPRKPARAMTQHFEKQLGKWGEYAAVVTNRKPAEPSLIEAIRRGELKRGEYAVVGLRQRVMPNPLRYGYVQGAEGETLSSLMKKLPPQVDPDLFLALNGLEGMDKLGGKERLVYPVEPTPLPLEGFVTKGTYYVQGGESLAYLANLWKVKAEDIVEANPALQAGFQLSMGDAIVRIGPDGPPAPPRSMIGTGDTAREVQLLRGPGPSGDVVAVLPKGTEVAVLDVLQDGQVLRVQRQSSIGFVRRTDLLASTLDIKTQTPPSAPTAPTQVPNGQQIVRIALRHVGVPYDFGGNSLTSGIDCSHFVASMFRKAGTPCSSPPVANMERDPAVHWKIPGQMVLRGHGTLKRLPPNPVSLDTLNAGDRIIIQRGLTGAEGSRHTGIYAGNLFYNGRAYRHAVVHAARPAVRVDDLTDGRLWKNYRFSVRLPSRGRASKKGAATE